MSNVIFIGNIEDQVNGGMIQVTLEEYPMPDGDGFALHCRVHQTLLPETHPFTLRVQAMYLEWQDHFAGSEDLDRHLYNIATE
jgi:hypothetical protein